MNNITRIYALVCIGVACHVSTVFASTDDKTLSPYFFLENGDPKTDQLPLESTKVTARIAGVNAAVTVKQTYKNTGTTVINAVYIFPASTRAAVYGMKMRIGDRVVEAKIKEKQQAQREFDQAKQQGKSASLLEQKRPNVFRMNLANILPGDRIDVELRYVELLVPDSGTYEFVYPTVVGPRYSNHTITERPQDDWVKTPYLQQGQLPPSEFQMDTTVSAGLSIQELTSPSHKITPTWQADSLVQVSLDASQPAAGNRDYILRYRLSSGAISSGVMLYEGKEENFFLLMVQPPKRITTEIIPPREYIFILDISGSMHGFPLDTAKKLMKDLVGNLRPTDTFNILLFSGGSYLLSPQSLLATDENITQALEVIDRQTGGGGTELLSALQRAMALPTNMEISRNFVVVTDGYISAEKDVFQFIKRNRGNANVFALGIGTSVNRYLVEGVAQAGAAEPFVVTSPSETPTVANRFRDYVQYPVLTNVKAEFHGFDAYDILPMSIADVLAERPIIVQGKWKGDANGTITVTGNAGNGPYSQTFDLSTVTPRPSNEGLRYLWARSQIADYSDLSTKNQPERKQWITKLGLRYNLLTEYTSFIAVHNQIRTHGNAKTLHQPSPLPRGVSNAAVGNTIAAGTEPQLVWLLAILLLLACVSIRKRRPLWTGK